MFSGTNNALCKALRVTAGSHDKILPARFPEGPRDSIAQAKTGERRQEHGHTGLPNESQEDCGCSRRKVRDTLKIASPKRGQGRLWKVTGGLGMIADNAFDDESVSRQHVCQVAGNRRTRYVDQSPGPRVKPPSDEHRQALDVAAGGMNTGETVIPCPPCRGSSDSEDRNAPVCRGPCEGIGTMGARHHTSLGTVEVTQRDRNVDDREKRSNNGLDSATPENGREGEGISLRPCQENGHGILLP